MWPDISPLSLDVDKCLPAHLAIQDIDEGLHKYGLVYKHYVNSNELIDKNVLKRRYYLLNCFTLFIMTRFSWYLMTKINSGHVPDYYFDVTKHFGGLDIYFHLLEILCGLLAIRFMYVFGRADTQHMVWLDVIRVLKGISPIKLLSINGQNYIKQFIRTVNTIHKTIDYSIYCLKYCFLLWVIFIVAL